MQATECTRIKAFKYNQVLKKILTMMQKEDSSGGNRRHPQGKSGNQEEGSAHGRVLEEGIKAQKQPGEELSRGMETMIHQVDLPTDTATHSRTTMMTGMVLMEGDNQDSRSRHGEIPLLAQTWPTPKESMIGTTGGGSRGGSSTGAASTRSTNTTVNSSKTLAVEESTKEQTQDSTEYKEDTRVLEVKTGLLPDNQASPSETTSERPGEEVYGTNAFGVQTIHGVPTQLWCTTRHQGAYTEFEVDEHLDWGTGKPESHWDYGDLELMSKRLAGT
jgi:hypothetical protein